MEFHCHITLPDDACEKALIHSLVQNGYSVASAGKHTVIKSLDNSIVLISLLLSGLDGLGALSANHIYDDILIIFNNIRVKYYSLIVTECSYNAMWCVGNISSALTNKLPVN